MRTLFLALASSLALAAPLAAAPAAAPATSLPGPDGGWDYARFDAPSGRLFVARSTSVTVYDPAQAMAARPIGQIDHGHAVIPLADGKTLLVTSGHDDSVRFLDIADGHEIARIAVGNDPDGAVLDPATGRAYVMVAKDGVVAVVDTATRRMIGTVKLKPGLEFPALADGMLYVNNEDSNEIETVDTRTLKAGAAIALPGCEGPSGLAFDAPSDRLISACDNGKAAVVDPARHRLVTLLDIGAGPDAVLLDAPRRRALIPCGKSGELDVVSLDAKGGPAVTARIATEKGARTGAIDPRDGTVYLPTAALGAPPAPGERPAPIAGSFHVLVVRP